MAGSSFTASTEGFYENGHTVNKKGFSAGKIIPIQQTSDFGDFTESKEGIYESDGAPNKAGFSSGKGEVFCRINR